MQIQTRFKGALVAGVAGIFLSAMPADADIFGELEAPSGFASGISNVQGWAFTNTPGAELIQPFDVLIDGEVQFRVPCCGDRGDVQDNFPGAPLLSGFSGAYNWGLAWTERNPSPELAVGAGIEAPAPTQIAVQVRIRDTMGGEKLLTQVVDLFNPTPWPRSISTRWKTTSDPDLMKEDTPAGILVPIVTSECFLVNDAENGSEQDSASLHCKDVRYTAPGALTPYYFCTNVMYDWDRASQSFKLASDCIGGYSGFPEL